MGRVRDGDGGLTQLRWIARLRWVAVFGQMATIALVQLALGGELPVAALLAAVAIGVVSNAALELFAERLAERGAPEVIAIVLTIDTLLLTAILWLTGGPSNPFGVLYLAYVTLAAVTTSARWTWTIVVLAVAGYGALFFSHLPIPDAIGGHGHHAHGGPPSDAFSVHLQGMFVAFALTACLIAWFVTRVTEALALERESRGRAARLVGLTTLAAGAAHELASPLATIKIAAAELERALASHPELEEAREDAKLVRREVERSRAVLDRLTEHAGEPVGELPQVISLDDLVRDLEEAIGAARRDRAHVVREHVPGAPPPGTEGAGTLEVPRRALVRAIMNLVDNALQASDGSDERIEVSVRRAGDRLEIAVRDRGPGMSAETLARIGEPFFTTKPEGKGMGLGIFLARTLAEQLGGALEHRSKVGEGTTAIFAVRAGRA